MLDAAPVAFSGRVLFTDGAEHDCTLRCTEAAVMDIDPSRPTARGDRLSCHVAGLGIVEGIRSDKGPEFIPRAVRDWIAAVGSQTAYIEPDRPWENGCCESFNAKLRDELVNGEMFYTIK